MKNLILTLGCILYIASSLFSQNYFYDEDRPLAISQNNRELVVHFNSFESFSQITKQIPSGWKLVKQVEKYKMVVLDSPNDLSNAFTLKSLPGFSNLDVRDENRAVQLQDGFNLWLGYQVLLEPKSGISVPGDIQPILQKYNASLSRDDFGKYIIEVNDPNQSLSCSNELVESGLVNWAHPNFYSNHTLHNDPFYPFQFQMNNTGQIISGTNSLNDIDGDLAEAWGLTTGNSSITVAVIDDGMEGHEDMEDGNGNSRLIAGFTPANNAGGTPNSNGAHGMACAGIIGASHNNIGVRGAAPGVNFKSVNIFQGSETTNDIANAFTWAKNQGADVLSNSWGYTSCTLSLSALNSAISDARNNGRGGDGCVVVFAAGNGYKSCVDYPADLSYVMAVGAVTNLGTHSNYSNEGPTLDVVAPSNSAPGQAGAGVRTIDREGSNGYSSSNYTSGFGGTSAACPLVAGVAALILSYDPSLTELEVRTLIENTATDMGSPGFDNTYGNGRVSAYDALMQLGGVVGSTCNSTVANFPYSLDFESGLNEWTQAGNDNFDWSLSSGSTSSSGTGPSSAYQGSTYLYTESSSPNYPNKSAGITSPCFDLNGVNDPTLSFAYNMYGSAMGELVVSASTDGQNYSQIWSLSGDQGTSWSTASISLAAYTNEAELSLRITGTTSGSFTSDIAIDDLSITEGPINPGAVCSSNVNTFPYAESFESTSSFWENSTTDDMNWIRRSGGTPSSGTGPNGAIDGSFYYYIESSYPNYPSKTAILFSPCLDLAGVDSPGIEFKINMYGSSMGTLSLEAKTTAGNWTEIWSLSGSQGTDWLSQSVDLSAYQDESDLVLRFVGTTNTSYTSDMAIDDIFIGTSSGSVELDCFSTIGSFPYSEGFEATSTAWNQGGNDNLDWTRFSGPTPSVSTGPESALQGTYYYYIEASSPNYPSKTANLISPCFDLSSASSAAVDFAYHMYGTSMGELKLEAKSGAGNWQTLWSVSGNQGNNWVSETVSLNDFSGNAALVLRFSGTTGAGFTSDMAIDGIQVYTDLQANVCIPENFTGLVSSYGGSQDAGSHIVSGNGNTVTIQDNAWKYIPLNYTITPNTILAFEFKSTVEGEIHGIGFDTDNNISNSLTFQLHGTQYWGLLNFNNYSGSDWQAYSIPVGTFFTGSYNRLTFASDNDSGTNDNSQFRNVVVYENGSCSPGITVNLITGETAILGNDEENSSSFVVYPNPAAQNAQVIIDEVSADTRLTLTDVSGKVVLNSKITSPRFNLDVSTFANGIYFIKLVAGNNRIETQKLIIAH